MQIESVPEELKNSVVKISTGLGSGSGFYIERIRAVVTNFHVIQGFREVSIELNDRTRIQGRVVLAHPKKDLALISPVTPLNIKGYSFEFAQSSQAGEKVMVLGYPYALPLSLTSGIVSSSRITYQRMDYIQTDAAVNPGNSGGPMLNLQGQLIGITNCKIQNASNIGFAIPISDVVTELESFKINPPKKYSVKCTSCDQFLTETEEECLNCGTPFSVHEYFEEFKLNPLSKMIEQTLAKARVNPIQSRLSKEYWNFYSKKSVIRIFSRDKYLYVTTPLLDLPKVNLSEFYRFILSYEIIPYQMGVRENTLYISYRVTIMDLLHSTKKAYLQEKISNFHQETNKLYEELTHKFECSDPTDNR